MQANEVAEFLSGVAQGGTVEIASVALVEAAISSGLARPIEDAGDERGKLVALQEKLRGAPDEHARRALRSEVLALSEAVAASSGGAKVVTPDGGGAYRGSATGGHERTIALTQRGRAFLADHGPRAERAASLTFTQFESEMGALRATLGRTGRRAGAIASSISRVSTQTNGAAWRSAAIGLSATRLDEATVASTFRRVHDRMGARLAPWTAEQGVAAAECLCLVAPSLHELDVERDVGALLDSRDRLLAGLCAGRPEHALDAAIVLAGTPADARAELLESAAALVEDTGSSTGAIPLPVALVCIVTGASTGAHFAARLNDQAARLEGPDHDRAAAKEALALGLASGAEASTVVGRILAHRAQLERFSPRASLGAAALLAWIDAPLSETLDDLRLCSSVVQTHRLAIEPGETVGSAVKLLLVTAVLGTGNEGDAEEKLALVARPHAGLSKLGMGAVAASVPLLVGATAAFVQPLLDAAAIWDAHQRATQGYVHQGYHHGHHYG